MFDLGVIGVVECTHTNCGCTSPCTTTTMLWSGKEKREREKGLEEEGKNKEKGVVFVGDFVAHHDGEWIVVVAKWCVVGLGVEQKAERRSKDSGVCGCGKMGSSEAQWLMRVDGKRDGCQCIKWLCL